MKKKIWFAVIPAILLLSLAAVVLLMLADREAHIQENTSQSSGSDSTQAEMPWPAGTEGLIFELNADKTAYTVIGCTQAPAKVVIPKIHESLPVTAIGERAFYCSALTEILLPDTIQAIGPYAFMKSGLERITLPEGLVAIEGDTFQDCQQLREVVIPSTVLRISDMEGDGGDPVMYLVGAFWGCTSLERIEIPGSVKQLGHFTFEGCTNLKEVVLHEGLEEIAGYTFVDCASLTSLHIPLSLRILDEYALVGSGVREITYSGTGEEFFAIHHVYYGDEMTILCSDGIWET